MREWWNGIHEGLKIPWARLLRVQIPPPAPLSEIYANHRGAKLTGVLDAFSYHADVAQLARVSAFQAEGCGFDPRHPLH